MAEVRRSDFLHPCIPRAQVAQIRATSELQRQEQFGLVECAGERGPGRSSGVHCVLDRCTKSRRHSILWRWNFLSK